MSNREFARQLEYVASHLEEFETSEQRAILRRAAIRLRSIERLPLLDTKTENLLAELASAAAMTRDEFLAKIIADWVQKHSFLPGRNQQDK